MTERVTLKPGDYVSTEWLSEDGYHAVADAFMAAGAVNNSHLTGYEKITRCRFDHFGWSASENKIKASGDFARLMKEDGHLSRHLTIDQVLTATNAGGKTQDTLTTIIELANDHDAKAKHHADEHERLIQQARDMLPDGWMLVRGGVDWAEGQDMADPANWREGDVVTCMKTDKDHAGDFEYGHTYTVNNPVTDFGWVSCIVSGAETNSLPADHFRFHHRPNT